VRRTSSKAFVAAGILFIVTILAMNASDQQHRTDKKAIVFSHGARPWNFWDIVWTATLTLSVSTAAAGVMFLNKDD
jgi:hypothetical protein